MEDGGDEVGEAGRNVTDDGGAGHQIAQGVAVRLGFDLSAAVEIQPDRTADQRQQGAGDDAVDALRQQEDDGHGQQ